MAEHTNLHLDLRLDGADHPYRLTADLPLDGDLDEKIGQFLTTAGRIGLLGIGGDTPASKYTLVAEVERG